MVNFSVIIPVYNREKIVSSAIESVMHQTYRGDWELILIDDGSKDDTLNVLKRHAESDSRIVVVHQENSGVSAARNVGLEHAKNDYILFLDSDDMLAENAMETIGSAIDSVGDTVDMVAFGISNGWGPAQNMCRRVIEEDEIRNTILPVHANLKPQTREYFLRPFVWNKCYRKEMLDASDIRFDEERKIWEDNIFLVSCLDSTKKLLMIEDMLYTCAVSDANDHLSSQFYPEMIEQYLKSYEIYKDRIGAKFNYNNDYTIHRYFSITLDLLKRAKQERTGKDIFYRTMKNPTMEHIIHELIPKGRYEKEFKKAMEHGHITRAYHIFSAYQDYIFIKEKLKHILRR